MQKRFLQTCVACFLFLLATIVYAQPSRQGLPASLNLSLPDIKPTVVSTDKIDWKTVKAEDQLALSQNLPLRAGFSLPVVKSIDNDGEWTQLPDGRMLWRLKLEAPSAVSLGVVFDMFLLPEGAELYLYNEDKSFIIGAFTSENNNPNNVFSTHLIPGSSITIEYIEKADFSGAIKNNQIPITLGKEKIQSTKHPEQNKKDVKFSPKGVLRVGELIYVYNDKVNTRAKDLGEAGSCQVNINCIPEGDNWQEEKRGVARIFFREGTTWYYCSGTLVNNTLEDGTPYFLTAYHCGATASAADHNVWQFYFNYERPGCANTGTPPNNMITGCVKRAEGSISGGTDMQLVELNSTPNLAWNPYYNGWDKSGNTTTGGVSIHHPSGDAKKISTFTGTTYSTTWSGGATNGHWRFPSWAATPNGQGVTEGGSSGSPLFNNAGRVIGTLTGGSSDCSNPSGDVYGKFSVHWQSAVNGTGNAYELKHWLDPAGTNPTTLDGMDPNAVSAPPVADFTATPINVAAGQAVQFNDRSTNLPQEWSWTFANGFPSSSTQRNPTCVWANPGTYTVSLTAKNKYGQDTETKTAYITVTGYTPPTSPKTIGGGTSTAANFPYGSAFLYKSVRSASIYTGDEIGGSGIIKQIAYYPTSSKSDSRKIKIYMKEVDYSTFSTAETVDAITANATLVLDGTFKPTPGGTWFTHTLQTPFEYNSAKNLLVVVVVDATSTGSSNCRYTAKTGAHQQWAGNTAPTGNGTINANRPNIRITIDPYVAPVANFGVEAYMFFEGFEGGVIPAGWTTNDVDGDGYNWFVDTSGASKTHSGKGAIVSASWLKDVGALTPNNWLITPAIDLSNTSDSYDLKYYVIGQDPSYSQEHYGVYVSTTGTNPANFTLLFEETLPSGMQEYEARKISLNAYKGNSTVYIAFRHFNSSDVFRINLDDVGVLSKLLQPTQVDVYEGEKLSLFDLSTNNPTLWKWSNPSGIPTESYVQNPDVQYNVQGVYDVSLTAANPAGSSSKTKTNYVNVIGRAPIADFYGQGNLRNIDLRPFIPIGGTVAYEEMSSRVPTAWNWAFTGGSPSTFSGKIPVDITYSSPGKYAASLTATNAHGTDTYTIPDFVVVGGKDTCTNLYPGDRLTAWGLTNGLIPGHAASGTTKFFQYAEYYDNQYAGKISGIQFYCYKAKGTGKNVTWYIWDGSTGSPGTVLWDSVITITSFTEEAWNFISMADVAVSGPFFIGYSLNYDATHNYDNHQFCTVGAKRDIDYSTAFISLGTTSPGTWVSTLDILDLSTSWVIHPEFTYDFTGTIVTATATPGCESGSVTLTSTKSTNQTYYLITGTGTPVANWTGTTNSHTFTGLASGDYKGYVVESGVTSLTSNLATLTNDTKVNVSVSISASPSTAICEGTSVTFTATPTNGGTSPTYKWYEGGVLSGETTNTFTTSTLTNGEGVYCVLTSDLSCVVSSTATSNTINTTVNPNKPVSVSIAANSGTTICAGTSVTFTATPTNGGSNPTYQWKVNGGNVGSNSATYTSSTLSNNDNVTCVLTSNATCATGSPATSNSLKMTVNPNLPVSVIISADPGTTICAGESVKFTANPTNGGSSPTYQWYVNGVSVGTGATYTTTSLANGNKVTCVLTSNATCATGSPATSNELTMTVNPKQTVSVSISANPSTAICEGTSVTFTANPTNGGTSPTYKWYEGGTLSSETTNEFTTTTLTNGEGVYCVLTSDLSCVVSSTATSNTINTTVNPNKPVSVSVSADPGTTICAGTSVTFTANATNGGSAPTYQWKVNGGNVGSNSATYTNASLSDGDTVTCVLTSNATCATGNPATSDNLIMTVNPKLPVSVSISADPGTTICVGQSVKFTANPTNGGSAPSYQWKINGTTVGTGATYTTTSLANGNKVTCVLTSNATCATGSPATSNELTMTVNPKQTVSVSISANPSTAICEGTSITFTASPTNGGTSPTYKWYEGGVLSSETTNEFTTTTLTNGEGVYCVLTSDLSCVVSSTATSNTINTTVNPNKPVSVSIAANSGTTICAGTSVTFTANATNGGSAPTYQWKVNGGNVGSNSATYTNASLSDGDTVTCVLTSNATCATGSPATSDNLIMTVNPNLPVSVSISANPGTTICAGQSVKFTANPTNGGSSPSYQWKVNGTNVGTSATYTTTSLLNGDVVTCVLTSNATCATGNPATSGPLTLTVNEAPSITAQPAASTIGEGGNTSFSVIATGAGLTYQWQVSTNSGSTYTDITAAGTNPAYSGWTSSTLNLTGVVPANNNNLYRCIVSGTCTPSITSNAALLTVNTAPAITSQPANASVCAGSNTSFTIAATGSITSYQWQVSTDGGNTYTNITAAGTNPVYSGWTTTTLSVNGVVASNNNYRYRCEVVGTVLPNAISNAAILTVNTAPAITSQPANASICAGSNTSFTVAASGTVTTYQWQVSIGGGAYTNITAAGTNPAYSGWTTSTLGLTGAVATNNGNKYRCIVSGPCTPNATSNEGTLTVVSNVTPSISIAANSGTTICASTSVTFTATPTNEGATPTYQWKLNGGNVGENSATYTNASLANGDVVSCVLTSSETCVTNSTATSNTVTMTVTDNVTPSISIATSKTSICDGESVSFNATPINGGATPIYQWKLNGDEVGENSATYTNALLANGDVVSCVLTSSATCVTNDTATSNTVTMTVADNVTPTVSIATIETSICSGQSVTFTATPTNEGSTPVYQWYVNSVGVGLGNATYTSTTLANGDVVSCVLTSNETCVTSNTATSNDITMTVATNVTPSISIEATPGNTICAGTSVTFTSTSTYGGSTPEYQWQLNGSDVGTGGSTYSNNSLVNGDVVSCVLTSNSTCVTTTTATSNNITMTVIANVTPSISIATGKTSICDGESVTFTATPINGGSSPSYQWLLNGGNVGTGATYTSTTLANSDVVSCILTSSVTCVTSDTATSNTVTMTVADNVTPSINIAADLGNTICSGELVTFTATPTNGGTNPVYQWMVNGVNVGSNSDTYTSFTLGDGNNVSCQLTSNAACATTTTATSNTVTMTVTNNVTPSIVIAASETSICSGELVTFTATPTNGGTAPTYQWKLNGLDVGENSDTYTNALLADGDVVTCVLTSSITCVTENNVTSNSVIMAVTESVAVSLSVDASETSICSGELVTFTATPTNGGINPVYQWTINGNEVGIDSNEFSSDALLNGDVVACTVTSDLVCATSPATESVTMSVTETINASIEVIASPFASVCEGTSMSFSTNITNGGTNPTYQWFVNNVDVGVSESTFAPSTLNNGDKVKCILTSNATCVANSTVSSEVLNVTISPATVGGSMSSMQTEVCQGESTGMIILSENIGDVLTWQRSIDGGAWTDIPETEGFGSFSEVTDVAGAWEYRAVVQSGQCDVEYSASTIINVFAIPTASFTYEANGLTVSFTNTSINATSYKWTFGDGATSTEENPTHVYTTAKAYNVSLVAYNGTTCQSETSMSIEVESSIIEFAGSSISLYPNPSNGIVNIELLGNNKGNLYVEVYDVIGKLIKTEDLSKMKQRSVVTLDLSNVEPGVYNIKFINEESTITHKVVIEK